MNDNTYIKLKQKADLIIPQNPNFNYTGLNSNDVIDYIMVMKDLKGIPFMEN